MKKELLDKLMRDGNIRITGYKEEAINSYSETRIEIILGDKKLIETITSLHVSIQHIIQRLLSLDIEEIIEEI